jgi:hypothetical protein
MEPNEVATLNDALRGRLVARMAQAGFGTARALAAELGYSYRSVENWLGTDTKMPAHFLARFVEVVPTDGHWLLTGVGTPEPIAPDAAVAALRVIARELDRVSGLTGTLGGGHPTPMPRPPVDD